jgi:hypothetical protein
VRAAGHYPGMNPLALLRHTRLRLSRRLAELIEDTTSFVDERETEGKPSPPGKSTTTIYYPATNRG